MKSISNSDFSLLMHKLPLILDFAKKSIPVSDLKACNALRMLGMLHKKLAKQNLINHKENDQK